MLGMQVASVSTASELKALPTQLAELFSHSAQRLAVSTSHLGV